MTIWHVRYPEKGAPFTQYSFQNMSQTPRGLYWLYDDYYSVRQFRPQQWASLSEIHFYDHESFPVHRIALSCTWISLKMESIQWNTCIYRFDCGVDIRWFAVRKPRPSTRPPWGPKRGMRFFISQCSQRKNKNTVIKNNCLRISVFI